MEKNIRNETLISVIKKYRSLRDFSRIINEYPSDVMKWKDGERPVIARATISICRKHPEIRPYDLNPSIFPEDCELIFNKK